MNLQRCANGHYYDADIVTSCPQCKGGAENMQEYDKTMPIGETNYNQTMPEGGIGETIGATEAFMPGATDIFGDNGGMDDYAPTAPVNMNNIAGFSPVTGWLVCIDGPEKGKDYRIKEGYSYIGRGENMDICLRGDDTVSRDRHAVIAYDDMEKIFFFGPTLGANVVRINNKLIITQTQLNAYDVISIGSSKYMFVPLCGEHFDWAKTSN